MRRGRRGEVLALLAGEDPEGPLAFARIDPDQGPAEHGVLAAGQRGGAPTAKPARTILILPASLGRLSRAVLPARTDAQARAAAPFLLEDSLATDAGSLHYAVGAAQTDEGDRLVAVIDKGLMQRFLDRCRSHGADPAIVVFDCSALQPEEGEAKAVETEDRLVIGAAGQGGVSLEPALGRALAARWLQSLREPVRRIAYVGSQAAALQAAVGGGVIVRSAAPEPVLEVLARDALAATEAVPNLRQGAFATGPEARDGRGRGWRIAAFFAAAAILAQAAAQGVAGYRDAQAAQAISAQAYADFRALQPDFPDGGDIPDAVLALESNADRARAHPVLRVSPPLTETLREIPEARLDSLSHEPGESGVRIVVSSLDPQAVQRVSAGLQARGLTVTPGAPGQSLTRVSQELIVEPGP